VRTLPERYLSTYTGKKFFPFDPRPEQICIEDIAHGLSMLCRFSGQCPYFYSVAEHSIYLGLAQQRYAKSHRIFANSRGVKDFRRFRNSQDGTWFSRSVLGA